MKWLSYSLQGIVCIIFAQTLYFKFSGSQESIWIFSQLQAEPWGRWATGILEGIACILLLSPSLVWAGASLGLGLMFGATASHIFVLGISVFGDNGLLFCLGIIALVSCALLVWISRESNLGIQFLISILRKAFSIDR